MRPLSSDPLRNFKFIVTIGGVTGVPSSIGRLGFMTADGFGIQNEVIPYREGGDNTTTRKMPGQTDFGPITFARGAMSAPPGATSGAGSSVGTHEVFSWMGTVFSAMEGQGTARGHSDFRSDITVDVLEHPDTDPVYGAGINQTNKRPIKLRFIIFEAWPMGLNWTGLDAGGNALMIETLQIAHEGFMPIYATTKPGNYLSTSDYNGAFSKLP